jgi:hypothetical protein
MGEGPCSIDLSDIILSTLKGAEGQTMNVRIVY